VYNRNEIIDSGVFIHLDPKYWEKRKEEIAKKKSERVDPLPLIENYHLEYILKRGGWDIIKNALVIDTNPNKISMVGVKSMKGSSNTEQLENILNPDTILRYFKMKDEKSEILM